MSEKLKNIFTIICIVLLLVLSFFGGRYTKKGKTTVITEYVKGETIIDTLYEFKPYKIIEPVDTLNVIRQCIESGKYSDLWPTKIVTEYIEVIKEDTTKVINDWGSQRFYSENLFDNDTVGNCNVNIEVQYNRLKSLNYTFTPINKEVITENYLIKTVKPFVGVGWMVNPWDEIKNPMLSLSGGLFINDKYGISIQLQHAMKSKADYIGGNIYVNF